MLQRKNLKDWEIKIDEKNKQCQDDDWSEDENDIPAGITDSVLTPANFIEDNEREIIYNVTPGEDSVPLSILEYVLDKKERKKGHLPTKI